MAGKTTINADKPTINESTEGKACAKNANSVPNGVMDCSYTEDIAMTNCDNVNGAGVGSGDANNVEESNAAEEEDEDEFYVSDGVYIIQLEDTIHDLRQEYRKLGDKFEDLKEDAWNDRDDILRKGMLLDEKDELLTDKDELLAKKDALLADKDRLLKDKDIEITLAKKDRARVNMERDDLARSNAELLRKVEQMNALESQVRDMSELLSKVKISNCEESQEAPGRKRRRILADKN